VSSFDERAHLWDKNARRRAVALAVAENIEECVDVKNKVVIDFGCGTGLLGYHFASRASTLVGYDTSPKMIEEFNKKSDSSSIWATDDFASLPTADLIVSSMTLHHIRDIEATLAKLRDLLTEGGTLCIADLISEDGSFHDRGNEGVYHFGFDPKELEGILRTLGMEIVCSKIVYTIKKHREFPLFLLCAKKR